MRRQIVGHEGIVLTQTECFIQRRRETSYLLQYCSYLSSRKAQIASLFEARSLFFNAFFTNLPTSPANVLCQNGTYAECKSPSSAILSASMALPRRLAVLYLPHKRSNAGSSFGGGGLFFLFTAAGRVLKPIVFARVSRTSATGADLAALNRVAECSQNFRNSQHRAFLRDFFSVFSGDLRAQFLSLATVSFQAYSSVSLRRGNLFS